MTAFFRPYEGKRPFVFISYSHRNTARVLEIITLLHEKKLRLWYDEGIPAGKDWSSNIESHMRTCSAVLFFRSETALASPNCYNEIAAAVERKHPLLIVPLDDAPTDEKWDKLLVGATTLPLVPDADAAQIESSVRGWRVLKRSFYRRRFEDVPPERIGLIAAILVLLITLAALYGVLSGRIDPFGRQADAVATAAPTAAPSPTPYETEAPSPSPTPDFSGYQELIPVDFKNSRYLERAVRASIGQSDGELYKYQLNSVTALLLCGHMHLSSLDDVHFDTDGTCRVGTGAVIDGDVKDLTPLADMPYLTRLALIKQPIRDLSPLNGLVLLEELWLSGNAIDSVDALNDLPKLHTLHLEHTDVRDLSALSALPALRSVTVSIDMLPLLYEADAPFTVRIVR